MRDVIYRSQEAEIVKLKAHIELLQQQTDELAWLNSETEAKQATYIEKIEQKKRKIAKERELHQKELNETIKIYDKYIEKLHKVMRKDHDRFSSQIEYAELQLEVSDTQVDILKNRIDKYLEIAKQAKSVLRIPRLCNQYHNKIKGVSESEAAQILAKIYEEWYTAQ